MASLIASTSSSTTTSLKIGGCLKVAKNGLNSAKFSRSSSSKFKFSCLARTTSGDQGIAKTEEAAATTTNCKEGLREVCKDTFWGLVEEAGDKVVVLDMYTQWCGPCKLILPKLVDLSNKYSDVVFFKLDCNQDNKPLAKELGIRVVPTFKILKHRKVVAEITGAKFEELVQTIEEVRTAV